MAEYIERSAVLQNKTTMTEYDEGGWDAPVSVVRVTDIEAIPAADVAPVVRGRWVKDRDGDEYCENCSRYMPVREVTGDPSANNYCPNCGAKVDAEGGEG